MKNNFICLLFVSLLLGCSQNESFLDETNSDELNQSVRSRSYYSMDVSSIDSDKYDDTPVIIMVIGGFEGPVFPEIYFRRSEDRNGVWEYFGSRNDPLERKWDYSFQIETYNASSLQDGETYDFKFLERHTMDSVIHYGYTYIEKIKLPEVLNGNGEMRKVTVNVSVSKSYGNVYNNSFRVNVSMVDNSIDDNTVAYYGLTNSFIAEKVITGSYGTYTVSSYLCCDASSTMMNGTVRVTCSLGNADPSDFTSYQEYEYYFSSDPSTRNINANFTFW